MSQNHNFRPQTGVATPAAGVFTYWVNASGALNYQAPNGSGYSANSVYSNTGLRTAVTSGIGVFSNGVAGGNFTGIFFGTTGFNPSTYPRVMGEPQFWLPVTGPNNEPLMIAAYTRS